MTLVDVREPDELQKTGGLPGCINIPCKLCSSGAYLDVLSVLLFSYVIIYMVCVPMHAMCCFCCDADLSCYIMAVYWWHALIAMLFLYVAFASYIFIAVCDGDDCSLPEGRFIGFYTTWG